ncbi:MAG: class I SAM-dependent methyltransferase [Gammaproteobacteria bacterium]|nr:class I SAM-dependent methyltransferase [Gammaproteobacteria bacterium]
MTSGSESATTSSSAIAIAVNAPERAEQSVRDKYRNPQATLEFFGLKEDMTVVEVSPGGGWYTSILNPVVKDSGKLIAAHFHVYEGAPGYYQRSLDGFNKKIASNPLFSGIEVTEFHPTKALDIAPEGSADMVLTFRNLHNWYMSDGDQGVENSFKAFHKALKKGGVLGVVDHRMPENLDQEENKRSGYIKQSYAIAAAEKAGFKLVAASEINANPKDTAQHPRGVWTLPPRLALGDENKDKYIAIGESDRMTLKFVKE